MVIGHLRPSDSVLQCAMSPAAFAQATLPKVERVAASMYLVAVFTATAVFNQHGCGLVPVTSCRLKNTLNFVIW